MLQAHQLKPKLCGRIRRETLGLVSPSSPLGLVYKENLVFEWEWLMDEAVGGRGNVLSISIQKHLSPPLYRPNDEEF